MDWTFEQKAELANLYHHARLALVRSGPDQPTVYERKIWAAEQYHERHPDVSVTAAYKELERQRAWRQGPYKKSRSRG